MTDKEKAEQFADSISGLELTCSLLAARDKSHAYRLGRYEGFLAGLEAGRPKWHDLRKNLDDLPKDDNAVLIYWKAGDYRCFSVVEPWRITKEKHIIAWREIPKSIGEDKDVEA